MSTIADLLKRPFSTRTFLEQQNIIRLGRPTPDLPQLVFKSKACTRHFQKSCYEKYQWLAGSSELNSLFCWNCLLFGKDRSTSWTNSGFTHLGNLSKSLAGHETTIGHLRSSVALASFSEIRIKTEFDEQLKEEISLHNQKVTRNRQMLMRLINAVCFLGKQGLAFKDHDDPDASSNRGNYVELLNYTAQYDPLLQLHLNTATVFKGVSNRIQNDLFDAVASSLLDAVKVEIKSTSFVSIMVDETTDVSNKAQFSIVLRYIHNGQILERFIGFCDLSSDQRAPAIADVINQYLINMDCSGKLVAQAYDGAAAFAGQHTVVQALIKSTNPQAISVHCYAHVLNLVLSQSVSNIRECKIFFSILSGLAAFFSRSPKRATFLDEFLQRRLPRVSPTRWNFTSRLVNTVFRNRNELCKVFGAMLDDAEQIEQDILAPVNGFLANLEDFSFCFFLRVFNKIFSHSDVLCNILQFHTHDILYCRIKIQECRTTIADLRDGFEEIFAETVSEVGEPKKEKNPNYRQIYFEIFDTIENQLESRFQDFEKLGFLELLEKDKFKEHKANFPEEAFQQLNDLYGKHFDKIRLRNELTVIYSSEEFHNKGPRDILKLFSTTFASSFPQTSHLIQLICTIPILTPSVETSISTLKRIKTYARNTTGEQRLSNLALISIESRLLEEIKSDNMFFDKVVSVFSSPERRMEFTFR